MNTKPVKALTIGGAVIDTIVQIASDSIEHMTMRNAHAAFLLVETGHKVAVEEITRHTGGGAVNAAVSMTRLGLQTTTIVTLGDDYIGHAVKKELELAGVDCRHVIINEKLPTGSSVLISSHERNAAIFTARGANTMLRNEHLPADAFNHDVVYVSSLSDESADCFPHILQQAKAQNAITAANPGIRQLTSRSHEFLDALANLDILAINRTEAESLMPQLINHGLHTQPAQLSAKENDTTSLIARGLNNNGLEMSFASFIVAMTGLGIKCLLITNGGDGAYAATKDGVWHCPISKIQVAGTVGAGDAFNSTFTAMHASGHDMGDCLRMATINAGSVVSHIDTQTGLLTRSALDQRVAEKKQNLPITHWTFE